MAAAMNMIISATPAGWKNSPKNSVSVTSALLTYILFKKCRKTGCSNGDNFICCECHCESGPTLKTAAEFYNNVTSAFFFLPDSVSI